MFSYLHRYHAGNFADVHKHLTLIALLSSLQKKATPFGVLDCYAGEGLYNLHCEESQKSGEYKQGIEPLFTLKNPPFLIEKLISLIKQCNKKNENHIYPGSPAIISVFMRNGDNAICIEGHPNAYKMLTQQFANNNQFHLHKRDALEALVALMPLKEKRGLIFIDPSYEVKKEYHKIAASIHSAYKKFSNGIYALWYPILKEGYHTDLLEKCMVFPKSWYCEWNPYPHKEGMYASGILLINPPWQIDSILSQTFISLNSSLFPQGKFFANWLSSPL